MVFRRTLDLVFLICAFSAATLSAQRYGLSFSGGFHSGIQTKNANDAPFESTRSYSLGSGSSRQLMFHYFPDSSNWFLSAGLQHFSGNGTLSAFAGSAENNNDKAQYVSVQSLRLAGQLDYSFHLKHFDINLHAGFVLPFAGRISEETWIYDSLGYSVSKARLSNYLTAGFSGGLSCKLHLSKTAGFFVRADLLMMNSRLKSRRVLSYEDQSGQTLEDKYPHTGDREFIYRKQREDVRNNIDVLPALYDKNKPTDKLTYTQSYSSTGLQFGFLFQF